MQHRKPPFSSTVLKFISRATGQPLRRRIRALLRFMLGQDGLDRLEFQGNCLLDTDIGEAAGVQTHVFVDDGERGFALEVQSGVAKRPAKSVGIDNVEQARTEPSMHLDAETDDPLGQRRTTLLGLHG
jgi:hypothetical protein